MAGTLSPAQMSHAARVGHDRYVARGKTIQPEVLDVQNAQAEQAVAFALNREWIGGFVRVSEWKIWRTMAKDVRDLQVRTTGLPLGGLVIDESDEDDHAFVLVINRDSPLFVVAGWILGSDAKQEKFRDAEGTLGPPRFLVPQAELLPCWDLRREPEHRPRGERTRDPAKDFGGTGRFPQRRYADTGEHPSKYGNIIRSKFDLPCCRCQTIIPAGMLCGGNLVTGNIHGDPVDCKKSRRAS